MPYLNIVTNQDVKDETSLLKAASQTIAKESGKPESYVMVAIEQKANMLFGGSDAPTAILDYRSLGLPGDRQAFSNALCTLINEQLGIDGGRIYISMTDSERQNWGWNHSTF
ncbi:phenylpyruvate tautomerase MIF-related protein [Methylophaga sp.]|uniref:phenylpyruvate tautomerase MIF-related protein n=1 Tax=Methylophaga sp. TaxID=2024840 RepID=UPI003F6A17CB